MALVRMLEEQQCKKVSTTLKEAVLEQGDVQAALQEYVEQQQALCTQAPKMALVQWSVATVGHDKDIVYSHSCHGRHAWQCEVKIKFLPGEPSYQGKVHRNKKLAEQCAAQTACNAHATELSTANAAARFKVLQKKRKVRSYLMDGVDSRGLPDTPGGTPIVSAGFIPATPGAPAVTSSLEQNRDFTAKDACSTPPRTSRTPAGEEASKTNEDREEIEKVMMAGHKAVMAKEQKKHNREVELLRAQLQEAKDQAAKEREERRKEHEKVVKQRRLSDHEHTKKIEGLQRVLDDVIDQGIAEQQAHRRKIEEHEQLQKESARLSELVCKLREDQRRGAAFECKICWEAEATHIVLPCGHFCMCKGCAQRVLHSTGKCPVCKVGVHSDFKVFTC
eukprot:TRINITY_DN4288_c1_g1_i1.p1 TRINITY_DN4288_c1_g1~~TRINITY_DN4288_c1_g1_i1.p1  ORF type:complete len:391 (-),score=89.92 TRINITY_DN4288_c1_g1_i1:186-1358(-)